jgi:hypothetical protein
MLSAPETAGLLKISHQALEEWRQSALILGVRAGDEWRYPELQFQDGRPLPRLNETLAVHHGVDVWVVLDSLMAKDSAYGGRSILDLLRDGDDERLDRVISQLDEQYAF